MTREMILIVTIEVSVEVSIEISSTPSTSKTTATSPLVWWRKPALLGDG